LWLHSIAATRGRVVLGGWCGWCGCVCVGGGGGVKCVTTVLEGDELTHEMVLSTSGVCLLPCPTAACA